MIENEDKRRCSVCGNPYFERNNYYYGKLMTVRDFLAEQCYFNEKRWLINRMVSGWGVVCGLDVKQKPDRPDKVIVTPGLAIDCCGREILVCEDEEVQLEPEESECHKEHTQHEHEKKLVICLEFHECKTEPINIPSISCDQKEKCESNRIRDYFKIRVRHKLDVDKEEKICPLEKENKIVPVHEYLCKRLKEECPECPKRSCLVLAEITITTSTDTNSYIIQNIIETCSRRKLVYSNPLLYSLIKCYHGDLPHIISINWPHEKKMEWKEFIDMIKRIEGGPTEDGPGLEITFDKDVKGINKNTFLFTIKFFNEETNFNEYWYIPGDITYDKRKAIFKVKQRWFQDIMSGSFIHRGASFQVLLRGDHILDEKTNQALDANFIGGELPSGNGAQGGDFISWFSVEKNPDRPEMRE